MRILRLTFAMKVEVNFSRITVKNFPSAFSISNHMDANIYRFVVPRNIGVQFELLRSPQP